MANNGFSFEDAITPTPPAQGFSFEDAVASPVSTNTAQSTPVTSSFFGSNRGVSNPNSAIDSDLAKSTVSGLQAAPFFMSDAIAPVTNAIKGTAADAYEELVGDLSPEQEKRLQQNSGPFTANEIYSKAGSPLYEPKTPMGSAANFLGNAVGMGAISELPTMASAAENASKKLPGFLGDTSSGGQSIPKTYPGSSDTQKALFQAHTDALTHDKDLYDWRDQMAQGKQVSVPNLKDTLTGVINDAKSQVANPQIESSAITKLNKINNKISDDGVVPLDALTDLDRYFNSLPSRAYTTSPINGAARGAVKTAIDNAAQTFPEFGDAHYAANDFHTNMKNEWENSVLDPVYNPDDTKNLDLFYRGKTRTPNPETQARGENLMENINSQGITGFNQVKNLLPDEASQNAFTNEFLDYVKNKDGNGRMNAIKNLIADPFNQTGRKIFDTIYPQYKADTKGLISANDGRLPYDYGNDNTPFSSYLADSKNSLAEQKAFQKSGGYGQSDMPSVPKLLTYDKPVMSVSSEGPRETIPINGPIRDSLDSSPNTAAEKTAGQQAEDYLSSLSKPTQESQQSPLALPAPQGRTIPVDNAGFADTGTGARTLPPPRTGEGFTATNEGLRRSTQGENYIPNQKATENNIEAQRLASLGYTPKQIFERINGKPPVAASAKPFATEQTNQGTQTIIPGAEQSGQGDMPFKRGGAVEPTEAQKAVGNYFKPKVNFQGLPISIENSKGSTRSGKDKDGKEWHCTMPCAYGYIRGTESGDGEHIDCFIGPNAKSLRVYIIDQKHHDTGEWDEHKIMLGFKDRTDAVAAYKSSFSDKKNRIMSVTKMLMPEFKKWLDTGNTKKPIG